MLGDNYGHTLKGHWIRINYKKLHTKAHYSARLISGFFFLFIPRNERWDARAGGKNVLNWQGMAIFLLVKLYTDSS